MNQQENYLARAEQLIIEQEQRITRQTITIERSTKNGYDITEAEQVLEALENFLIDLYAFRKKLLNKS